MAQRQKKDSSSPNTDVAGRFAFIALLLIIPSGAFVGLFYVVFLWQVDVVPAAAVGTDPILGAFDPVFGTGRKFLIGALIFVIACIVEAALLLAYGTFYIYDPRYINQPLGLPPGAVRVFILIMVVFSILLFAFLPSSWADNKAVALLFGILSTVVGFYFGSQRDTVSHASNLRLSLVESSKIQHSSAFTLSAKLAIGTDQELLGQSQEISIYLMSSDGKLVEGSEQLGVFDSNGFVEFNYTGQSIKLGTPGLRTSYIIRVQRPKFIQCDDRLVLDLPS